ncbi:DciA family protein [Dechloromonas sp. HYN0024]|uniref:DciA family protein n=1 Tax=Dechloromonas sp. HYN0024 TaxID=2231055 RepID=UPI0013C30396|nr:DciA family protein [Dechloromonas sp. HYN0024]
MYNGPEHYLDKDAAAGRVMAHARLLLKLSRRFEAVAPAGLRHSAHVANYKLGIIIIHADNGAVAAKIRQLSQRLGNELSKGGVECSGIEVKVQPRQIPCQSTTSTQKPISGKAIGMLRSTTENLPEGPLRKALENLVKRAATTE